MSIVLLGHEVQKGDWLKELGSLRAYFRRWSFLVVVRSQSWVCNGLNETIAVLEFH
jgi:hypothetical protein